MSFTKQVKRSFRFLISHTKPTQNQTQCNRKNKKLCFIHIPHRIRNVKMRAFMFGMRSFYSFLLTYPPKHGEEYLKLHENKLSHDALEIHILSH